MINIFLILDNVFIIVIIRIALNCYLENPSWYSYSITFVLPLPGFDEGWLLWDDTDQLNSNRVTGEVPEGVYDDDTLIYFCCREDGFASTPVTMPTDDNFFLFKKTHACQEVEGMGVNEEWFRWDSEENLSRVREYTGGSTPYNTGKDADHLLHYCYYYTGAMD